MGPTSEEGRLRCIEAGKARIKTQTAEQRQAIASRGGQTTLLRYSREYYGDLGRRSADMRTKPA
jgi:hypothetical protein